MLPQTDKDGGCLHDDPSPVDGIKGRSDEKEAERMLDHSAVLPSLMIEHKSCYLVFS